MAGGEKGIFMSDLFYKILQSLDEDYEDKKWGWLALKIIGLMVILCCTTLLLVALGFKLIEHINQIVVTIGSISCFFLILYSFIPKKKKEPDFQSPDSNILEYDPITLENTYRTLRRGLSIVIGEVADTIKVKTPSSLSQLDCPTHFTVISRSIIYHFLVAKISTAEFDVSRANGILQNAIENKLNNQEMDGITQSCFFYNGQIYPSLLIDNVKDLGQYVQIDIAIASDYYCAYRSRRIQNMMQTGNIAIKDRDF
jgi:hypothetical protein